MTAPRQVLQGTTYLISRRCCRRQLLLKPTSLVSQIILYCLTRGAERVGVLIHAVVFMSNHVHVVATDPKGRIPEFTKWFFEFSAKCMNVVHGRWENFWSSEQPSQVELKGPEDIVDKILYVMCNPVAAALVPKAEQWPGVVTLPKDVLEGPVTVIRPPVFFRKKGKTPMAVELETVVPPGFEDMTSEEFVEMLNEELALREEDLRRQHAHAGRSILGRRGVLAQDPHSYPAGMEPRGNLNPRIAAKNKWRRIEAIRQLKSFLEDYASALRAYLAGDMDALFPAGTYWMVKYANAHAAPPG